MRGLLRTIILSTSAETADAQTVTLTEEIDRIVEGDISGDRARRRLER